MRRISELFYDSVQEKRLLLSCRRGGRRVEYALEASPSDDHGLAVNDAALDERALDLDSHHDQDDVDVSVEEAS